MQELSKKMGVEVLYGGQHKTEGTHNAVVNLGNGAYLELLAIDEKNTAIASSRWMGIDLITEPIMTRWALKSTNLPSDVKILQTANPEMGEIFAGSRKKTDGSTLRWAMVKPLSHPMVEILPFMVDWKDSVHPTMTMPDVCKLIGMRATHPTPHLLQPTLNNLGAVIDLQKGNTISLEAVIQTPNGVLIL